MAVTLGTFDTPIRDKRGRSFTAKVCGREDTDHRWEGWIEFEDAVSGDVLRTTRETTQPNLADLQYWASGLSEVYLEGALGRILRPVIIRQPSPPPAPVFDGPAGYHEAVLNPFSVYGKNPDLLAQELTALRGWHLRQIIRDYRLAGETDLPIESLTEPELAAFILQRVRDLRA
jgi:hypothetical protein